MDFERYVEDFNRYDGRELVERWYADDVVVELAGHLVSGKADWTALLEDAARGVQRTVDPVTVVQADGVVMAELDETCLAPDGRADFPLGPLEPGKPSTFKLFAVYRLRDDRIASVRIAFWPDPLPGR